MSRLSRLAAWGLWLGLAVAVGLEPRALAQTATAAGRPQVVTLRIDGEVEPVMAEYVTDAIDRANEQGAALILITIDTPGGLDTSMRQIIQRILDSTAPVAVFVTPSGARAASAGFFILLSADVAAMAPGTHTGAASPVFAVGGFPVTIDETMKRKVLNDATAYLRSYAAPRRRNVALAETAITDAKAFTEREALDGGLVDLVADSPDALLARLDGRTLTRFNGRTDRLDLSNAETTTVAMSARQRFLARIVAPDMFFVLLIAGVLGLYAEFTHPGLIVPGVIGGISLVLALYAMHILPVNFTGLLLIGLALALFILEAHVSSHGVLGAGGAAAMLIGALMLIRSPITGAGVSLTVALGVTLPCAVITVVLMRLVLRSRRWKPQTGVEEMVSETGEVTEPIGAGDEAFGQVFVHGERWRAAAPRAIPKGARVRVVRVDGLTVHVEPL